MNRHLPAVATSELREKMIQLIVNAADRQGWLMEFLAAAARWWPTNVRILKAADAVGVGVSIASWSDRKWPARVLEGQRAELARVDAALCAVARRRHIVATGVLVAPDVVVTAADASMLGGTMIRFPAATGTTAIAAARTFVTPEVCVIRLAEAAGEHFINGLATLRRGTVAFGGAEQAEDYLALWRRDLTGLSMASIHRNAKVDPAAAGTPCFDAQLGFAGLLRFDANGLCLAAASSIRKAVEAFMHAG